MMIQENIFQKHSNYSFVFCFVRLTFPCDSRVHHGTNIISISKGESNHYVCLSSIWPRNLGSKNWRSLLFQEYTYSSWYLKNQLSEIFFPTNLFLSKCVSRELQLLLKFPVRFVYCFLVYLWTVVVGIWPCRKQPGVIKVYLLL